MRAADRARFESHARPGDEPSLPGRTQSARNPAPAGARPQPKPSEPSMGGSSRPGSHEPAENSQTCLGKIAAESNVSEGSWRASQLVDPPHAGAARLHRIITVPSLLHARPECRYGEPDRATARYRAP